jgi:hypothetical protein
MPRPRCRARLHRGRLRRGEIAEWSQGEGEHPVQPLSGTMMKRPSGANTASCGLEGLSPNEEDEPYITAAADRLSGTLPERVSENEVTAVMGCRAAKC